MSTKGIDIRVLGVGDAQVLDRVDDDVFDFAVSRAYAEAFLADPNSLLVVALQSDTVVGMVSALLYLHPDKPLQMFINEVGVAGDWQRRGIGKALVECVLEEGRARGCAEAWIATEVDNAAARGLYMAAGGCELDDRAVVYTWTFRSGDSST